MTPFLRKSKIPRKKNLAEEHLALLALLQTAVGKPTSPPPKTLAHVLPPTLAPMSIGDVPRVLSYPNLGVWDKDFLPRGPFLQELGVEGV